MFNILVKIKFRKCALVTTKLKVHSKAKELICPQKIEEYQKLVSKELNISESSAAKIMKRKQISNVSLAQLKTSCIICRKYNIKLTTENATSRMLSFQPLNIHNRILLLKECGATCVTDKSVGRFYELMKMRLEPFKTFGGIPEEVDIVQKFFENSFPKSYEPPPLKNLNLELPFKEIRMQLLSHYVLWRFQISEETLIANPAIKTTLRFKSLTMINETFEYLIHEFGWDLEKIQKRHTVTLFEINNVKRIKNSVPTIDDWPIHEAAYKYPPILKNHVNNIKEILAYLQEKNIPLKFVRSCLRILTYPPVKVRERMNSILSNSDLCVFRNNPNFLWLIYAYDNLENRVNLLNSLNFSCVSLHSLISSPAELLRLHANGFNLTKKYDLETFLDYEIPIKSAALIKVLQQNPNWLHIPLQQIAETMQYLKQRFSIEDICNNIQALLYHHDILENTWKFVQDQYENYEGYHFTTTQKLALCLYHLELQHHFSGNSILIAKTDRKLQICLGHKTELTNK